MNIIISSLDANGMKVTGASQADINSAKLFIAKSLNVTPLRLELILDNFIYSLNITASPSYDKANFNAYNLTSKSSIPLAEYQVKFYYQNENNDQKSIIMHDLIFLKNGLEDDDKVIMITNRKISDIGTVIVAEDRLSQQLTFSLQKKYDGISFLSDTKHIYVDYIPVGFQPYEITTAEGNVEVVTFLSEEITETTEQENSILLKWNIPSAAIKNAGEVKVAISVHDFETGYVWQTLVSSFNVFKNIGKRMSFPVGSMEEALVVQKLFEQVRILEQNVDDMQKDILDLEETVGFQSDDNYFNDREIIINGGNDLGGAL